jgi:hypothetical protein
MATRVEKTQTATFNLNGRAFRFEAASIAPRRIDEFMWCAMATRAKKTQTATFNSNGQGRLSFRFEAASIAPRRIDEFMWCDDNMRQKTQTANLQLEWPGMSFVSLRSRQHRATAD